MKNLQKRTVAGRQALLGRARIYASLLCCLAAGVLVSKVSPAIAGTASTVEDRFRGLASGVLGKAVMEDLPPGVLVRAEGLEIKASTLDAVLDRADPQIRAQLEKNLLFLLEQETAKRLLAVEARKAGFGKGKSEEEAIKAHLRKLSQEVQVSDGDARAFYEGNREMVGGMPFEQVRESIKGFLLRRKQALRIEEHIRGLGEGMRIAVNGEWVQSQARIARDNPVDRARMSGRPSMVEFGADGCVPCDMMQPILAKLRKTYGDRLNVLFVHVRKEQILGARFGIRAIPVQVFFDRNGKEFFRHEGFFPEEKVKDVLKRMGL